MAWRSEVSGSLSGITAKKCNKAFLWASLVVLCGTVLQVNRAIIYVCIYKKARLGNGHDCIHIAGVALVRLYHLSGRIIVWNVQPQPCMSGQLSGSSQFLS